MTKSVCACSNSTALCACFLCVLAWAVILGKTQALHGRVCVLCQTLLCMPGCRFETFS